MVVGSGRFDAVRVSPHIFVASGLQPLRLHQCLSIKSRVREQKWQKSIFFVSQMGAVSGTILECSTGCGLGNSEFTTLR